MAYRTRGGRAGSLLPRIWRACRATIRVAGGNRVGKPVGLMVAPRGSRPSCMGSLTMRRHDFDTPGGPRVADELLPKLYPASPPSVQVDHVVGDPRPPSFVERRGEGLRHPVKPTHHGFDDRAFKVRVRRARWFGVRRFGRARTFRRSHRVWRRFGFDGP